MDVETLYALLPAVYRARDAEQGEPLKALIAILAEQAAVIQENLAQLYDDQFIETAAAWVVPYLGDLIGYRPLYGVTAAIGSPRAEVAHTLGYRRRKGTAAMLAQLARDVTGWDAQVVEFFRLLATTQYMNHIRPDHYYAPDLRRWEVLEALGTPFEALAHTADIRRISRRRGRYNIPNVGIFLWRIAEQPLTRSVAHQVDAARFTFNPLGLAAPLFNDAVPAEVAPRPALNVPQPIGRRALAAHMADYYGRGASFLIEVAPVGPDGLLDPAQEPTPVPMDALIACDLRDVADGTGGTVWAHTPVPAGRVAVDPVLGRLAFGTPPAGTVLVSFHYGFSAELGGGEYERAATFDETLQPVSAVTMPGKIGDALSWAPAAVEVQDSGRYAEVLNLTLAEGQRLEIRARNGARPALILGAELAIAGGEGSELTLNGLLIAGGALRVTGGLRRLRLVHCTLVPGHAYDATGRPRSPTAASLIVEAPGVTVEVERSIVGPLAVHEDSTLSVKDSIVDALADDAMACCGPTGGPSGPLTARNTTFIGCIHARTLPLASNCIFLARSPAAAAGETPRPPVWIAQRQAGCVRFSYVPPGSRAPRRYKCQPARGSDPVRVRPQFTSLRYGDPGYGQLGLRCAAEIRAGADDGSEMGAFHDLYAAQREVNLRVRLDEYLRFGLEAGIFYVS